MSRILYYILFACTLTGQSNFSVPIYSLINFDIYNDSDIYNFSESDKDRISVADSLITYNEIESSIVIKPKIIFEYEPYINGLPLEMKLGFAAKHPLSAPIKSTISFNSSARYKIKSYTYLKVWHSYIPSIYIRNYRDRDDLIHQGSFLLMNDECRFGDEKIGLSYTKKISSRSMISSRFQYSSIIFDQPFNEYNLKIYELGISLKYLENKRHTVNFDSRFIYADNFTRSLSNQPSVYNIDRSYIEFYFVSSLENKRVFHKPNLRVGISLRFIVRQYISEYINDPIHYQRSQLDNLYTVWAKINTKHNYSFKPFISYRMKDVFSPYDWVVKLKGFNKYNFGLKLSKRLAFDIL